MQDVIFDHTLLNIGDFAEEGYLCHAYCHKGECTFAFNGKRYTMVAGDCLIVRRCDLLIDICESDNFQVDVVYASSQFVTLATPQSNYGNDGTVTQQYAALMNRFLALLERGDYCKNREIGYYADILCVTPKYLSEVSKKVSGYPANFWITRYTSLDIARLLRSKRLTFTEIADMFEFS